MRAVLFVALSVVFACVASAQDAETGYIDTAPGVSIFVERIGDGAQVVIVPGRLFLPQARALATPDRTLLLYDMRNRGASARVEDDAALTILGDIADLEAVRAHFGAERAALVGFSYLGLMVAQYAVEHPDRVTRIVQLGPAPRSFATEYPPEFVAGAATLPLQAHAAAQAFENAPEGASQAELCALQRAYTRYVLVGDPVLAGQAPDTCVYGNEWPAALARHFGAHFTDIQTRDFPRAPFAALAIPVLTIHGTLDRNAPYGGGREWAQTFPDGRLITVPDAAHAVWIDDPTVFEDIDAFLDGRWPDRAVDITP